MELAGAPLGTDRLRRDSIVLNLIILGEATKQVSEELRKLAPSIPWSEMARMRDVLTHGYFRIDDLVVEDVVANELPALIGQLQSLIDSVSAEG